MASKQAVLLVTGATGFVGSHVVDRLLEGGRTVRCLVRSSSNLRYLKDPRLQFAYGGLDDATDWDAALSGVDTIYHVAGLTFARRARDYFEVNQRGTERLLAAALKHREQIKKFVLVSSLAAIGPARDGTPVDEDARPAPITPYGQSKLMAEEAVRAFGVALAAEGVAALTRKPPVINRDKVRDLSERCWGCSIERAKRELGYNPQIPIEAGLRETIDWYKREGWL